MIKPLIIAFFFISYLHPMEAVKNLDIDRFMGRWYVISIIPNLIEKYAQDAYDEYSLNQDGTVDISYHALKNGKDISINQKGTIIDDLDMSTWEISFIKPFIPFFKAPYKVIVLDKNYDYMVIGYPKNKYGWIMARSKDIGDKLYNNILQTLEEDFGYKQTRFVRVNHRLNINQ